ncbi:hypothetical protein GB937_004934 [Aspergillus fischeri]|nr:hypothetical protein GB937_004934 [Aspergillus fischeri]
MPEKEGSPQLGSNISTRKAQSRAEKKEANCEKESTEAHTARALRPRPRLPMRSYRAHRGLQTHLVDFVDRIGLDQGIRLRQHLSESFQDGCTGLPLGVGELDVDDEVQVAPRVAALERHAFSGYLQNLAGR